MHEAKEQLVPFARSRIRHAMKYIFPAFKFDYEQIVRKFCSKIEFENTFTCCGHAKNWKNWKNPKQHTRKRGCTHANVALLATGRQFA